MIGQCRKLLELSAHESLNESHLLCISSLLNRLIPNLSPSSQVGSGPWFVHVLLDHLKGLLPESFFLGRLSKLECELLFVAELIHHK